MSGSPGAVECCADAAVGVCRWRDDAGCAGDERKKCVQNSGRDFRRPVTIVSKAAQPNEQLIDFIWFIFIYIILLTIIII